MDFFRLNLRAGDILTAMTVPLNDLSNSLLLPDMRLGLFDSEGLLLVDNDDAGNTNEGEVNPALDGLDSDFPSGDDAHDSAIKALTPAEGEYFLGVTGFGDGDFDGINDFFGEPIPHTQIGNYALVLGVVPDPSSMIPGDFDGNGVVDADDIDLLCDQLDSNGPPADEKFDLNNDGMVNSEDADVLILDILGTEFGDADLMGGATLGDLGTLVGSFVSTRTDFGWADGDFNWDGQVTLSDLGILAANFESAGPIGQAEFEAAVEGLFGVPYSELVPEPATAIPLVLAGLLLMRRPC